MNGWPIGMHRSRVMPWSTPLGRPRAVAGRTKGMDGCIRSTAFARPTEMATHRTTRRTSTVFGWAVPSNNQQRQSPQPLIPDSSSATTNSRTSISTANRTNIRPRSVVGADGWGGGGKRDVRHQPLVASDIYFVAVDQIFFPVRAFSVDSSSISWIAVPSVFFSSTPRSRATVGPTSTRRVLLRTTPFLMPRPAAINPV